MRTSAQSILARSISYPSPWTLFTPPTTLPESGPCSTASTISARSRPGPFWPTPQKRRTEFAIFEATRNHWKNHLITLLVLPFASAFLTTFLLRPFRISHLICSLVVPVLPFTAVFDGLVSNLRTYSPEDLRAIIESLGDCGFEWETGLVEVEKTGLEATYLFGWRKSPGESVEPVRD